MICAEIGLNHLGSSESADSYLDKIIKSGCDGVTFQVREEDFYRKSVWGHCRLDGGYYGEAVERCRKHGLKFGFALADFGMLNSLRELKVDFVKLLSKDLGNRDFVNQLYEKSECPVYASTGLSGSDEIRGFLEFIGDSGRKRTHLIQTQLSNELEATNLRAISKLRDDFGSRVAFGLHCTNHLVSLAAMAFEPSAIFFYVRESSEETYPDHEHAVLGDDLFEFVGNLRDVEKALGTGNKRSTENKISGQLDEVGK